MKIKEVSVTYGRKVNLGNYNNANLEMTVSAALEDGDVVTEVTGELWSLAKEDVKAQLQHLINAYKEKENPK